MNKEVIHILLVDDDEEDYLITRDLISDIPTGQKYMLDWTPDYHKAMELIYQKRHDVYLVDYRLGVHSGLDIIEKVKQENFEAPFILLTGQGDSQTDEKAMEKGAADYLVKGTFSEEELGRVIRYSLRDAQYIKDIRNLNSDLEKRVNKRTGELEQSNKDLQRLLQEREITQRELQKALDKEKELGQLKARFVTMASHEFRTPLSTILSSVNLIEKYEAEVDRDKRLKHIQRVKSAISNLTETLNDILSLSKLEEGKVGVDPVTFDLNELVEESVQDIELIKKNGQVIRHNGLQSINPLMRTDKKILKNLLINLLSNAVKYSPENKEIMLNTNIEPGWLHIEVIDQGIGIPEKDQKHLFERFFRAENATMIQGTGLGLSIVKKYLDLLGGRISFRSKLEEGTTFRVEVPYSMA